VIANLSDKYFPIWILLYIKHFFINLSSFMGISDLMIVLHKTPF